MRVTFEVRVREASMPPVLGAETGQLSLDRARIRAETAFNRKFLVNSSDDELSAEEIALGYKQL